MTLNIHNQILSHQYQLFQISLVQEFLINIKNSHQQNEINDQFMHQI